MQASSTLVQTVHLNCLLIHTQPKSLFLLYYVGLVLCVAVVNLVLSWLALVCFTGLYIYDCVFKI